MSKYDPTIESHTPPEPLVGVVVTLVGPQQIERGHDLDASSLGLSRIVAASLVKCVRADGVEDHGSYSTPPYPYDVRLLSLRGQPRLYFMVNFLNDGRWRPLDGGGMGAGANLSDIRFTILVTGFRGES